MISALVSTRAQPDGRYKVVERHELDGRVEQMRYLTTVIPTEDVTIGHGILLEEQWGDEAIVKQEAIKMETALAKIDFYVRTLTVGDLKSKVGLTDEEITVIKN